MHNMDWENRHFFVICLPKLIWKSFAGQRNITDFWNISAQEWCDDQEWADNNWKKWYYIRNFQFVLVSLWSRVILFERIRIYRQRQFVEIVRCLFLYFIYMVLKSLVSMKKIYWQTIFWPGWIVIHESGSQTAERRIIRKSGTLFFVSLIFGFIYVILTS